MNYYAGRFLFILQIDGNLVLYATPNPLVVSDAYWATIIVGIGLWLIYNQSGQVYLMSRNGTVLNILTSDTIWSSGFYQRAILQYGGVFRQYVHPKMANLSYGLATGWSMVSFVRKITCVVLKMTKHIKGY